MVKIKKEFKDPLEPNKIQQPNQGQAYLLLAANVPSDNDEEDALICAIPILGWPLADNSNKIDMNADDAFRYI